MIRHLRFADIAPNRPFHARRVLVGDNTTAHDHDFWEAFWVSDGQGRHVCNGRGQELKRGDMWLVRPPDVHSLEGDEAFSIINVAWPASNWTNWLEVVALSPDAPALSKSAPELGETFARMSDVFASGSAREPLHLARFWAELAPHFWPTTQELDPRPDWLRRTLERFEREDGAARGYNFLLEIAPVSPRGLHREWTRAFGQTPSEWVAHKRLERAALLLLETSLPVQEIALRCGFDNAAYFYRVWKAKHGVSPNAFRAKSRRG